MKKPMVSIIVPVYNVEAYVGRCLASLVSQTYKELEILLIDDGSSDQSGNICEQYAAIYPFIRCIHQKNQGLSATRNIGMRMAKGSYWMFVDSDDYIEENMVERMMTTMLEHAADIVVGSYWMEYPSFTLRKGIRSYQSLSTIQGLQLLLENKQLENFAWGKLYRASLFETIQFPEGRFEDIYTIFQVFAKAHRIVTIPQRFYHYVQRKDSLTNVYSLFVKEPAFFDEMEKAFAYQETQLRKMYPDQLWDAHRNYYVSELMKLLSLLVVDKEKAPFYTLTLIDLTKEGISEKTAYYLLAHLVQLRYRKKLPYVDKECNEQSIRIPINNRLE